MFDCKGELTFDLSHIKAESKCRYGELTNKSFIVETGRGEGEESRGCELTVGLGEQVRWASRQVILETRRTGAQQAGRDANKLTLRPET